MPEWKRPGGVEFSRIDGRRDEGELLSLPRRNAHDGSYDRRFPRSCRIRRRSEYLRIQTSSRGRKSEHFVVVVAMAAGPVSRLGVTASRKVGSAVERNRIKRRVREFFRSHRHKLQPAQDLVIIARAGAEMLSYKDVESELGHVLGIGGDRSGRRAR